MEREAVYYGKVELIPGIICDGYVLDDDTAVMSERGTADLLGIYHHTLQNVANNWPIKTLKPFIEKDLNVANNLIEVTASNSHHKGKKIVIYTSKVIETLIRAYALAFANDALRKNQIHIGKRCVIIQSALVRTALDSAIKEACGINPQIQKIAQKNYVDAKAVIREFGFKYSIEHNIAIKKDITNFLKIPESTLNNFLRKHSKEINPIRLDTATIRSLGIRARRLNGYKEEDVAKIALGMDTQMGMKLKQRIFGQIGTFVKPKVSDEIQWRDILSKVFQGFDLRFNYPVGKYRADFFVATMGLCLECNGYDCHQYYDPIEEAKREKKLLKKYSLLRFHHQISLETLFNGILQSKKGRVIKLYNIQQFCNKVSLN